MIQDVFDVFKRINELKERFGLKNTAVKVPEKKEQISFIKELQDKISTDAKNQPNILQSDTSVKNDSIVKNVTDLNKMAENILTTQGVSPSLVNYILKISNTSKSDEGLKDFLNPEKDNNVAGKMESNAALLKNYLGQSNGDYKKAVDAYIQMKKTTDDGSGTVYNDYF